MNDEPISLLKITSPYWPGRGLLAKEATFRDYNGRPRVAMTARRLVGPRELIDQIVAQKAYDFTFTEIYDGADRILFTTADRIWFIQNYDRTDSSDMTVCGYVVIGLSNTLNWRSENTARIDEWKVVFGKEA